MILFVGYKKTKSRYEHNNPFLGTKTYKKVLDTIYRNNIDIHNVKLCNTETYVGQCAIRVNLYNFNKDSQIYVYGPKAKKEVDKIIKELDSFLIAKTISYIRIDI